MDWRGTRDRWLGSPAVRARISRLPLGRRVADRHAHRLFGIVAGFAQSQLLAAAVELGVFDTLLAGARSWTVVTDLPPAGSRALCQGLIALGLIEARGDMVGLTVDGLVVATDPALRAMIRHNRLLYADLTDPVAMLRGGGKGRVAAFWPYDGAGVAAGYSELMAASNAMVSDDLIASGLLSSASHLMDVGGGSGTFLLAVRRRYPTLRLTLVDLPAVVATCDLARQGITVCGAAADSSLPAGADTITLLRVLHDQSDPGAATLLSRVAAALPVGGRVVIVEPIASSKRDAQTAYFAAYFAAMRSGRLRTQREIAALLAEKGFGQYRVKQSSPLMSIISAVKQA